MIDHLALVALLNVWKIIEGDIVREMGRDRWGNIKGGEEGYLLDLNN